MWLARLPLPQADKVNGLALDEVERRKLEFGPNALEEKSVNPLLLYLGYFWGPMPVMIWYVTTPRPASGGMR
jgi:H+-transporting ATPase